MRKTILFLICLFVLLQAQPQNYIYAALVPGLPQSSSNKNITLEISIDSTDYYVGQQFTYFLNIRNNSNKKVSLSNYMLHREYFDIARNKKILYSTSNSSFPIYPGRELIIPITETFNYFDDTIHDSWANNKYWSAGKYILEYDFGYGESRIRSNQLTINIYPVPKRWKNVFDSLVSFGTKIINVYKAKTGPQAIEKLIKSYSLSKWSESSIYDRDISRKLVDITSWEIFNDLYNQRKINDFLLNPNSSYSWGFYRYAREHRQDKPELWKKLNVILKKIPYAKKQHLLASIQYNLGKIK